MPGSLIRPFQPVTVRGFSKYTRITISRSSACRSRSSASLAAYSRAAFGSCTEHGPVTTSSRSSAPSSTARTSALVASTVCDWASPSGCSRKSAAGESSGS